MIKVWGRNTSSNVQKVMWAVEEIGLPHERIDIGGPFGKNREPAYLAMNPNGLVPTLEEDDGFLLWESNAIVRYLAAKHRAQMLEPADLHARAQADAWMDWQLSVLGPPSRRVSWAWSARRLRSAITLRSKTQRKKQPTRSAFSTASWRSALSSPATPSLTATFRRR